MDSNYVYILSFSRIGTIVIVFSITQEASYYHTCLPDFTQPICPAVFFRNGSCRSHHQYQAPKQRACLFPFVVIHSQNQRSTDAARTNQAQYGNFPQVDVHAVDNGGQIVRQYLGHHSPTHSRQKITEARNA